MIYIVNQKRNNVIELTLSLQKYTRYLIVASPVSVLIVITL